MGLFDRAEKGLERAVSSAFAKAFRAEVQPVEIASHIRSTMDVRAAVVGPGRVIVPNRFAVQLSPSDYERLESYGETLVTELVAAAEEHRDSQRYATAGPIRVLLEANDQLDAGVIDVVASASRPAPRRVPTERRQDPLRSRATGPRFAPGPESANDTRPGVRRTAPPPSRSRGESRPYLDLAGQRYPLLGAITVLGRDDSADIILEDTGISRRHSEIRVTHDLDGVHATLRDLGSTNGTYLNGERISSARLADGDNLTIGRITVRFRLGEVR